MMSGPEGLASLCDVLGGLFAIVVVTNAEGMVLAHGRHRSPCTVVPEAEREPIWSMSSWTDRDRVALRRAVRRAAGGNTVHLPSRPSLVDGAQKYLDMSVAPLRRGHAVEGLILTGADVTARVEGERRLRESDERLRLALEAAEMQSWEMDLETNRILRGSDFTPLIGLGRTVDTRDEFMATMAPEDRGPAHAALEEAIATGGRYSRDHRCIRDDGSVAWIRSAGRVVRDASGKPVKFRGVAVDVTERKVQELETKSAHDDIARRESHLRSILSTIPSAMVVTGEDGCITMFSRTAEQMFGYTAEEVMGRNVRLLMPQKDRAAHDASMAAYAASGRDSVIARPIEGRGRRKDGDYFPLEVSIGVTDAEGGRFFTAFITDVTGRRETAARLQELNTELTHVSRGSAMGQLATMLAHELNQPLAAATNYVGVSRLLAGDPPSPGPAPSDTQDLRDALDQATQQLIRAGRIISNMREFVARGGPERRRHDPVDLVEEALALGLAGDAYGDVDLVRDYPVGLPLVLADRIQVQQVVINLVRNAREAMNGQLSPRIDVTIRDVPAEGVVRLSVTDAGPGLAPDVAEHLFTPFRTTKRTGLGLGLSISKTIVNAHGGSIWAEPAECGTTFFFTLQAAPPDAPSPPPSPRRAARRPKAPAAA